MPKRTYTKASATEELSELIYLATGARRGTLERKLKELFANTGGRHALARALGIPPRQLRTLLERTGFTHTEVIVRADSRVAMLKERRAKRIAQKTIRDRNFRR